ncbi:MAG: toxic anion resistance protein, partial [Clostridiales bacterium]|nr:toxic anion resistance protein [Clostridiales bacterium]
QMASTQLAAQIRMVPESDALTCEKLQTALEVTIPLWKSQMAAALGLARATDSMAAQRRISEEAARGIRSGARETQAQTRAFAAEAASGDPKRAQETAEELLRELSQIEESLERQQQARRQTGA